MDYMKIKRGYPQTFSIPNMDEIQGGKGDLKMSIDIKEATNEVLLESFEYTLYLKNVVKMPIDEDFLFSMREEIKRRLSYWEPHLD